MKRFLLWPWLVLSACHAPPASPASVAPQKILAIVAHPDDETTMGPVLARYGKTDSVFLIIATDGQFGVTEHAGIPAGDSLVEIRAGEAACSCRELGIEPPILLGLQDGLGLNGHGDFYEQIATLKPRLLGAIQQVQPDIILTFGPDGDTGHPDHRMVGLITTELLLREDLIDQIELYFFGWSEPQTRKFEGWNLGYVHRENLDTEISFSTEAEAQAFASIRCHVSQFSAPEMEKWITAEDADTSNVIYFRKFAMEKDKKRAF